MGPVKLIRFSNLRCNHNIYETLSQSPQEIVSSKTNILHRRVLQKVYGTLKIDSAAVKIEN